MQTPTWADGCSINHTGWALPTSGPRPPARSAPLSAARGTESSWPRASAGPRSARTLWSSPSNQHPQNSAAPCPQTDAPAPSSHGDVVSSLGRSPPFLVQLDGSPLRPAPRPSTPPGGHHTRRGHRDACLTGGGRSRGGALNWNVGVGETSEKQLRIQASKRSLFPRNVSRGRVCTRVQGRGLGSGGDTTLS